ncbi:gastrula zinc finger protein XlCGF57.1-like [Melanotaenia boesemani]|uniref:gastrula zinc finger protein XlCGF57.1-like n=1 Tax=Melanotaenia boesemani TaxID=1250792 RepID=UPI001C03B365|nr:gastrula zinc finger protein XlCGF57.1-like [Melanotaenia boesemani]
MSRLQGLKVFISQRLTAAVDDILGHLEKTIQEYEEETERRHRDFLDVVLTAEMKQHRAVLPADIQQLLVGKEEATIEQQQDKGSSLNHEDPKPQLIHIKDEQEEVDVTKITFSPILVKSEDEEEPQSLQLHQNQTEENIINLEEEDCRRVESDTDCKNEVTVECNAIREPPSRVDHEIPSNDTRCNNWNSFKCSECGKRFGSLSYLKLHIRCHTGERPYRCPVCRKCFSWRGRLQKHMRIHTGEKPFRCSVCGKMFSESGNLKVHMRIHTGEKPFSCAVCGKSYAQRGNLKMHMAVHKGEAIFGCSLHQSSQLHHSHTEEKRNSLRGPESVMDSDPNGHLQAGTTLGFHNGTGNSGISVNSVGCTVCKKPFSCSECGKRFGFKGQLKAHMRCHTGEKPFRCPVCWKCFSWNGCLQKHMKIHTGEKPYICTVCGKGFVESGNLKVHMRIHTGEKPFSCSICSKRYRQKGSLTKHLEVHRE